MAHSDNKRAKDNNNIGNCNRFAALDDYDDDSMVDGADPSAANHEPREKIPPLKILGVSAEMIHNICTAAKIDDYCLKKISIGIKVHCESTVSYELLKKWLTAKKFEYFTHPKKCDKPFKAVMFGLENEPADEVKRELIKHKLKCVEVKVITKDRDYGTDTLYIVYFEHGSTNLQQLKSKVPSIFHTIIRWEHQRRPRGLIAQCRNCQLFGHGESNCHVATKCALCGKDHKTATCTVKDNFSCANCGLNHKASDWQCPQRNLYEDIRQKSILKKKTSKFTYCPELIRTL